MSSFLTNNFISDESFNRLRLNYSYKNQWTEQEFGYYWEADHVVFYNNYMAAPRIAYYKYDDKFIFTLERNIIKEYFKRKCEIEINTLKPEDLPVPINEFKESIRCDYYLEGVQFIEHWDTVKVYKDGTFEVKYSDKEPYSLDLRENKDVLKAWILKYKKIVDKLMDMDRFRPVLTGGLDSRCMAGFYRYRLPESKNKAYYLRAMKLDGKNEKELGMADVHQAYLVAKRLGLNKRTETMNFYYSISAIMNENGREFYNTKINDPIFVYKFIQHAKIESEYDTRGILKCSTDDLYLSLKHPNKDVMRCVLALLMAEDLMDIPLIGAKETYDKYNQQPYSFYEEYTEPIKEAKEILAYWGEEFKKEIDDILHGKY